MVFDPTETYLYSADLTANKIWTHKKDAQTGQLELIDCLEAPSPGDHPRWVEMHASGKYLYVLMEAGNRLGVYVIDERTHKPVFTHITYPLLPSGKQLLAQVIAPSYKQEKKITNNFFYRPPPSQQVPRRRNLHHQERRVPVRHHSLQPLRRDRLHHCLQAGSLW